MPEPQHGQQQQHSEAQAHFYQAERQPNFSLPLFERTWGAIGTAFIAIGGILVAIGPYLPGVLLIIAGVICGFIAVYGYYRIEIQHDLTPAGCSFYLSLSAVGGLFLASIASLLLHLAARSNAPKAPIAVTTPVSSPTPTFRGTREFPLAPANGQEPTVMFGSIGFSAQWPGAGGRTHLLGGSDPFNIHVENGRIFADIDMYAGRPDSPIVIHDNNFDALPPDWDYNSNSSALEIVDRHQNPVFQMYYLSPTELHINGIFLNRNTVVIADPTGGFEMYPIDVPKIREQLETRLKTFKLTRMFKYPGKVFPGVPN